LVLVVAQPRTTSEVALAVKVKLILSIGHKENK
jgi:hypothetical protein